MEKDYSTDAISKIGELLAENKYPELYDNLLELQKIIVNGSRQSTSLIPLCINQNKEIQELNLLEAISKNKDFLDLISEEFLQGLNSEDPNLPEIVNNSFTKIKNNLLESSQNLTTQLNNVSGLLDPKNSNLSDIIKRAIGSAKLIRKQYENFNLKEVKVEDKLEEVKTEGKLEEVKVEDKITEIVQDITLIQEETTKKKTSNIELIKELTKTLASCVQCTYSEIIIAPTKVFIKSVYSGIKIASQGNGDPKDIGNKILSKTVLPLVGAGVGAYAGGKKAKDSLRSGRKKVLQRIKERKDTTTKTR